ncbi:MAG: HU family DNA-binding protein, partial [Desulfobacula sp.]|nr:HU family DNA-binding protein [Desulfobacula sp.]
MNKLELISTLKEKANLTKSEASEVIKIFFDSLSDSFVKGERVEIRGFCSFHIK